MSVLSSLTVDRAGLFRAGLSISIVSIVVSIDPLPAEAIVLAHRGGSLDFNTQSGDFQILGGSVANDVVTLYQNVTGPNFDLTLSIDGLPSLQPYTLLDEFGMPVGSIRGFWFQSVLTNSTQGVWEFFDHELQEAFGTPSTNGDGLSFGQGLNIPPPTSDRFSTVEQTTDVRDFLNFSNGTVNPGETVTFTYFISDTSPTSRFFLRQRPNFQPGNPQPTPIPTPTATPTPDPANVPEPNLVLGILALGSFASLQQFRRRKVD
ncbi:MAG: hypothetical protein J7641_12810 [Cyanobacteria bacterium SID2]|nr:hypothetical protein [Cyanobacteria bacterium SID2]MBP0004037.1 hypothetical protein [Cyanobacteria bacterium SBC]